MHKFIVLCRRLIVEVPLLPIAVVSAIPLALCPQWRPWDAWWGGFAGFMSRISLLGGLGVGQWVIVLLVLYTIIDTVRGMIDDLRNGQVGVDLLAVVAIASTVAVHEFWASWAVVLMISSGEAIESFAQAKAEGSLSALIDAAPQTAHVVTLPGVNEAASAVAADGRAVDGRAADEADCGSAAGDARHHLDPGSATMPKEPSSRWRPVAPAAAKSAATRSETEHAEAEQPHFRTVPVAEVHPGDVLTVLPGETVPVDGVLLSGTATLDMSTINGEPVPGEVFAGATVLSGAVNGSTTLTMRATKPASDSQYQQIMKLVESAQESRPAVVRTADRLAVPFTVLSLLIGALAWALSGTPLRFAQVLVLATPCPLLIAAPVAYIAGTGRMAKAGIVVKSQGVLETLGRVQHVFFDKTGTLTVKRPQVVRVEMLPNGGSRLDEDHVLMMAGVVEGYSAHVLANGIAKAGRQAMRRLGERNADGRQCADPVAAREPGRGFVEYPVVRHVEEVAGKGVSADVDGHRVLVGRLAFADAAVDGFQPTAKVRSGGRGEAAGMHDGGSVASPRDAAVSAARARSTVRAGAFESVTPSAHAETVKASSSLTDARIRFAPLAPDEMAAYVSVDGLLIARIVLRDVPRADARAALDRLRELGVNRLTMLTGDKRASADIIAREVGITDVHAELFPEDKVAAVREADGEDTGRAGAGMRDGLTRFVHGASRRTAVTMMVGDGVNDAPVLAAAGIGVAITDGTSTAASQSAQVVIMNDSIAAVAQAVAIARRTKRVMLQAVLLGLALALAGMVAAAFNLIPVVVGAFLQEAIDVVSILWALTAMVDRQHAEWRRSYAG